MKPKVMTKLYLVYDNCIKVKSVYYNFTNSSLINAGMYAKNEGAKYFFFPFCYSCSVSIFSTDDDLSCVAILNPFEFIKEDNLIGNRTLNLIMEAIKKQVNRRVTYIFFSLIKNGKNGARTRSLLEQRDKAKEDN